MKTSSEWMEEWFPSNDSPNWPIVFTKDHIEAIQRDAIEHLHNNDMPESEIWKDMYEEMRLKWHEARRYLRAANKGAQRNAEALALCQKRYWDLITSDNRLKERDLNSHKTIVWNWLLMSDDEYRLKCGELSAQDLRNIRAVLKAMLGTSLIKHL
jgi:hypothetical protein